MMTYSLIALIAGVIKEGLSLSFEMKSLSTIYSIHEHSEAVRAYSSLRRLNATDLQTFDDIYNIMTIEICIAKPNQCFDLLYDTGMMYMIVGDAITAAKFFKRFDVTKSLTIRSEKANRVSLAYRTGIIRARETVDYVFINEASPATCFHFLLGYETSEPFDFDGILGLGRAYPEKNEGNDFDKRYSFIEYLYENKLIKRKLFGHEYINRTYGQFFIDELPKSFSDGNYAKCINEPFIPYLAKWHCEMRSLSFSTGELFTEIASPVVFDTGYVDIKGPKEEGSIIFQHFLNISGTDCHIEERGTYQKFLCNANFNLKRFPHIRFNLKGIQLTFFNEDMFRLIERNNRKYLLSKMVIAYKQKHWEVGEPVLKNYNMIFDYDNNIVGIVSNVNYEGDSWLIVIVLSSILAFILLIVIWLFLNRKRLLSMKLNASIQNALNTPTSPNEAQMLKDIAA